MRMTTATMKTWNTGRLNRRRMRVPSFASDAFRGSRGRASAVERPPNPPMSDVYVNFFTEPYRGRSLVVGRLRGKITGQIICVLFDGYVDNAPLTVAGVSTAVSAA